MKAIYYVFLIFLNIDGLKANSKWDTGTGWRFISEQMEKHALRYGRTNFKTKWIEQPLDHFNAKEPRTWKMKYLENRVYFKNGGPILLYIGGEGPLPSDLSASSLYSLVRDTRGAMFVSEHRYYGDSIPINMSIVQNMKYLTSEQALADLSKLIRFLKSLPEFKNSKVAVVGGSYAGNLAAWMRLKYPDLIDAAWSSSAPVLAKKNFSEYIEKVAEVYKTYGGPDCYERIDRIFRRYEQLLQSADGIKQLKREENICKQTDMTKPLNKAYFMSAVVQKYMAKVQNEQPLHIAIHCSEIKDKVSGSFKSVIDKTNDWKYQNHFSEKFCTDYEISNIQAIQPFMWSWYYQTCTEFGYYQTTDSYYQPFTKNIVLQYYIKRCSLFYGPEFDEKRVDEGVAFTNKNYGGLTPNVTKVVFVHGGMDPWSKLGVTKSLSVDAPALIIPHYSHCKDLQPESYNDSKELKETRKFVLGLLKKWLGY